MPEMLQQLREHLKRQYQALYSQPDWDFAAHLDTKAPSTTWVWQTQEMQRATDADGATGAALLDPEIGTCLYLQIYNPKVAARQQISRALHIRSSLLPGRKSGGDYVDEKGAWRVLLHWLVTEKDMPSWIDEVAEIRELTAHFEEVPIDAVIASNGNWERAFDLHGFPRLLFKVRATLKMNKEQVERWQTADRLVSEALSSIATGVIEPIERQCASDVLAELSRIQSLHHAEAPHVPSEPIDLFRISIQNFRNIKELSLVLREVAQNVAATVVQGPNGSGKSSVFEAISLGVSGASERYERFLADANKSVLGATEHYLPGYLRSLSTNNPDVRIAINNNSLSPVSLADPERVPVAIRKLGGSLLSQEESRSFVSMNAAQLGGEIAAGLSAVASEMRNFVDNRLAAAQEQLRAFNTKWGLRATVTRRETVAIQVCSRTLLSALPNVTELLSWLKSVSFGDTSIRTQCSKLAAEWQLWRDQATKVSENISKGIGPGRSRSILFEHMQELSRLTGATSGLFSKFENSVSGWTSQREEQLVKWGKWLQRRSVAPEIEADSLRRLVERERELSATVSRLVETGRLLGERAKHFEGLGSFLPQWAAQHPDTCPTCESNVAAIGGIQSAVQQFTSTVQGELREMRARYAALKQEMTSLTAEMETSGAAPAPISPEERVGIEEAYGWLLRDGEILEHVVTYEDSREDLLRRIHVLKARPSLPIPKQNVESWADEFLKQLESVLDEHDRVTQLPDAWKAMHKRVLDVLSEVTSSHLPKTLQGVWLEIARNVMPAAWQFDGNIQFQAGVNRRSRRSEAAVVITNGARTVLASHILNGAEIHNLGLAWFFTKYLVRGRFDYHFIVLDDPSDTMDQPTFRDLCRFLETLLRLHQVNKIPLSLVMLFHQDQRALDATRAMNAVLYPLRWNRNTQAADLPVIIRGEQMSPPFPLVVLE